MRRTALLPLVFVAACTSHDPRAEAERLVKPPELGAERAALPGSAAPTLAATDALTWLERGPDATEDACGMQAEEWKGFFPTQVWRVSCTWRTTRYYGFDGDFPERAQAVDDALVAAGWPKPDEALSSAIRYFRQTHKPGYDVSHVPPVAYHRYIGDQPWTVQLSWAEAGRVPAGFRTTRTPVEPLHREAAEVDPEQVHRDLTSRHQFVLVFSLSARYFERTIAD
ncbi:hypothetical protein AB0M48_06870 [Lentzea sp. NPDC051208]|uniref:hypothetical protein n=1 Tax=Lentzea sp. NPDC051208 TaxID=3154642 RepID=UPI00343D266E